MRRLYYIEFTLDDYETDPPYLMQSQTFISKDDAKNWFYDNFDYVAMNADLMVMNFKDDSDEYEIDMVCRLN